MIIDPLKRMNNTSKNFLKKTDSYFHKIIFHSNINLTKPWSFTTIVALSIYLGLLNLTNIFILFIRNLFKCFCFKNQLNSLFKINIMHKLSFWPLSSKYIFDNKHFDNLGFINAQKIIRICFKTLQPSSGYNHAFNTQIINILHK